MLSFEYIDTQAALDRLVKRYQKSTLLVLDTEFVRTRTYYAKLGLIQVYDGQILALIDPLVISDFSGFWALLTNEKIIKILHSCSEDLEIIAHYGNCQPKPLFDTQIAAALCGFGHGIGYAKLVEQCLSVSLDKGESRTDWLKRPLSQQQLSYAANDVYYLYRLYPLLLDAAKKQHRLAWIQEESLNLTQNRLIEPDEEQAYLKVKNVNQLSPMQLAYVKVLAKWRLQQAISRDMALGFVIKDHALTALAKKQPKTLTDLNQCPELTPNEKQVHGNKLIKILQTADLEHLPEPIDVIAFKPGYKVTFKKLKASLSEVCNQHSIPEEMLASKRYIHEYLRWYTSDNRNDKPTILKGWRAILVGNALENIEIKL